MVCSHSFDGKQAGNAMFQCALGWQVRPIQLPSAAQVYKHTANAAFAELRLNVTFYWKLAESSMRHGQY